MDTLFDEIEIDQNDHYNLTIKSGDPNSVTLELHRVDSDGVSYGDRVAMSVNRFPEAFYIGPLIDMVREFVATHHINMILLDESVTKLSRDDLAREFLDVLVAPNVLPIRIRVNEEKPRMSGEQMRELLERIGPEDDTNHRDYFNRWTASTDDDGKDVHTKYPIDPLNVVTSQFTPKEIVHKDATFIMAVGDWKDKPLPAVAVRWHEPGKIGYPNGFGKPQWMLTPIDPKAIKSMENPFLPNAIRIEMLGDTREVSVGSWAKTEHDWHLITYVYGEDGQMVSACGLGKSGAYPLRLDEIEQVVTEGRSLMDIWFQDVMGGDICLWSTPTGRIWLTFKTPPAMIWSKKNPKNVYSGVELIKSPLMDTWYYGKAEERVFDYMLDGHILLGRISPKDVSKPELDEEVVDYIKLRRCAVEIVNHAIWVDVLNADEKKRTFEDDVKSVFSEDAFEQQHFSHDIVMGCSYIDLT